MYLIDILKSYSALGNNLDDLNHIDVLNNEKFREVIFFKEDGSKDIHPINNIDASGIPTDILNDKKDISYTQTQIKEAIRLLD